MSSTSFCALSSKKICHAGAATKGKPKEKKDTAGRQTTLFGLPAPPEKKPVGKKKKASEPQTQDSQATAIDSQQTEPDSQDTDVVMVPSTQPEPESTQIVEEESQVPTEVDSQEREGSEEPIEWPDSPVARTAALIEA